MEAERDGRLAAEARAAQLEAELRRLRGNRALGMTGGGWLGVGMMVEGAG